MADFLLTWNPKKWTREKWEDLNALLKGAQIGQPGVRSWSCSQIMAIEAGDRFWLIRLGGEPCGIIAYGEVVEGSYEAPHYNDPTRTSQYVKCRFDKFADPDAPVIPRQWLTDTFPNFTWSPPRSGNRIHVDIPEALIKEWRQRQAALSKTALLKQKS